MENFNSTKNSSDNERNEFASFSGSVSAINRIKRNPSNIYRQKESLDVETYSEFEDQVQCNCQPPRRFSKECGVNGSCCWYEYSENNIFSEYCRSSSLHGVLYLGLSGLHVTERILWAVAFLLSCASAGYLIGTVWIKYVEGPVIVTFESSETFISEIPFPAVTICNMNKVLRSKAEEYMTDAQGADTDEKTLNARNNLFYLDHVCSTTRSFSKLFNYASKRGTVDPRIVELANLTDRDGQVDIAHFLQRASQPCTDMLKLCMWQDEIFNCSELFSPIETNFGKCCSFNAVPQSLLHIFTNDSRDKYKEIQRWKEWNLDFGGLLVKNEAFKRPRRQRRAGKTSGLSILLNPGLQEYFCTSSDSLGFRLVTHLPIDNPHVTDFGIAIKPNTEVFTNIRPEMTIADETIRAYSRDKRNCYVEGEFGLAYYAYYTAANCYDECIANRTFEMCGCIRYYHSRDGTKELCGPNKFECAENVKKAFFRSGMNNICQVCLPTCTELGYYSETTQSELQNNSDLWLDDKNVTAEWSGNGVSIVHVFFGQDSTYPKLRTQLYGWTDLVSNCGGILGLCMGFSGLSVIEIFYYFTMRAWCGRRRRIRQRRKTQAVSKYGGNIKSNSISYIKPKNVSSFEKSVNELASNNNSNHDEIVQYESSNL